jgi:hypothetical protein
MIQNGKESEIGHGNSGNKSNHLFPRFNLDIFEIVHEKK